MAREEHKDKGRHAFRTSYTERGIIHRLEWFDCA